MSAVRFALLELELLIEWRNLRHNTEVAELREEINVRYNSELLRCLNASL
jgi:hypothetical protein